MRMSTAMLADAATVRENLVHVLGGGITTLTRPALPAPLEVDLVLMMEMDPADLLANRHVFIVSILHESGEVALQLEADLSPQAPVPEDEIKNLPTPYINVPVVLPLRGVSLNEEGLHNIELRVDGELLHTLTFRIILRPDLFGLE